MAENFSNWLGIIGLLIRGDTSFIASSKIRWGSSQSSGRSAIKLLLRSGGHFLVFIFSGIYSSAFKSDCQIASLFSLSINFVATSIFVQKPFDKWSALVIAYMWVLGCFILILSASIILYSCCCWTLSFTGWSWGTKGVFTFAWNLPRSGGVDVDFEIDWNQKGVSLQTCMTVYTKQGNWGRNWLHSRTDWPSAHKVYPTICL